MDSGGTSNSDGKDKHSIPDNNVRPEAFREANILHTAFFNSPLVPQSSDRNNDNNATTTTKKCKPKNERMCMGGHKEVIFGLSFSHDGKYMASASQDSTICIWDTYKHKLVAKLSEDIDQKYECLRTAWCSSTTSLIDGEQYLLASAGADGIVRLWSATLQNDGEKLTWRSVGKLDHYVFEKNASNSDNDNSTTTEKKGEKEGEKEESEDRPQIYTLQFIQSRIYPNMNLLMTSTNDTIHIWNVVKGSVKSGKRKLLLHLSVQFTNVDDGYQFGGERNPSNELYVFDASYCEANELLGVALSDGSCRILSLHKYMNDDKPLMQEQCVLRLPPDYFGGKAGHLTALCFDQTGTRLASCIASGRVILWVLQVVNQNGVNVLHPSCVSILDGGHDAGRPLFGAKYCGGKNEDLLLTWGVDGKVCLWDSFSQGDISNPLCTLISHTNYPIYALDITTEENEDSASQEAGSEKTKMHIAIGGGTDGGFLGVPTYMYII